MTTHIRRATADMLNDLFESSVRRLDTLLEQGDITPVEHALRLRHMVEAVS